MPQFISNAIPDWNNIEATRVSEKPTIESDTQLKVATQHGDLLIEINALGIRIRSDNQRDYDYGMLQQTSQSKHLSIEHSDDSCVIISDDLRLEIAYSPFSFALLDSRGDKLCESPTDGHFVRRHRVPPLAKTADGWYFGVDLKSNESIYGLGEKWGSLNKRGQLLRSYNWDALGVNAEISYKNTPFAWSPEGWAVFSHTPSPVTHSVGNPSWSQRSYISLIEDDTLDIFILVADANSDNQGAELISAYTSLTGTAPMPPNWSGGVILSKAYYQDPQELLEVAREVRKRKMPCDVITIDGRAWQDTDTRFAFEWDKTRWPDPKPVLDELKSMGFKICIWEYPLISIKHDLYKTFDENGWFLKDKRTGTTFKYDWDQQAFGEVLSPLPVSGIVDFTNPGAYEFWKTAHKDLFEIGVDMIKADFGEQLEDENMLAHNGVNGDTLHNVYSFLYNRCVYEAAEEYAENGPFIFSRSAWIGSQRLNSQWGGDPQADWEGMMGNIRGGISWGLSGAPFYATDVGGFYKDTRDDNLYVRWAQAAVFSAHFRLHGIGAREPWSYSDKANSAVMDALHLRYRLQAYLQITMQQAVASSTPVQRPMVLAFPHEKQSWAFENQFMFGDDLLVAPCFNSNGDVEFYLPEGEWCWFDLKLSENSSELLSGGKVYQRKLNIDQMAVFARVKSEIPLNIKALNTIDIPVNKEGMFVVSEYWSYSE